MSEDVKLSPLLGALLLVGCVSAEPLEPTWSEMDFEQRRDYMTQVVEPDMRELFQARDPQRWSDFYCHSCHGADAVERDYAMPNQLAALPLEGTLDHAESLDPELTTFMLEQVFPVFVELLDESKYAHEDNPDGYRCTGCHAVLE